MRRGRETRGLERQAARGKPGRHLLVVGGFVELLGLQVGDAAADAGGGVRTERVVLQGVLVGQRRAVLRDVEGARVQRLRIDVHDELREREAVGEGLEPRVRVRVEGEAGADVLVGRAARLAQRPVQVLDERHLCR